MKDFLKYVLANFVALAIVGAVCFFMFLLFLGATLASGKPPVMVPPSAVLVFNMDMPIVDKPTTEDFRTFINDVQGHPVHTMTLNQVVDAIDEAATDKRIHGLFLTGNVTSTSWANLCEIREAILRFKASNKPVISYHPFLSEVDYYLVSLADEVLMHPAGVMELNGFASEVLFFKEAFLKYGIDVQVTRVGKYKSAVEPFLLDKMSDPNREQLTMLLDDIFKHFLKTVETDRGLEPDSLRALADAQTLLAPERAKETKLVSDLVHYDEVLARLRKLVDAEEQSDFDEQISLRKYAEATALQNLAGQSDNRVLVVYAEGQIVDGHSRNEVGGDDLAGLLRRARLDETVKAVVLRVNSPGGTVTASEVIGREVELLRKAKPLVVSMGDLCASGGYWISSHADQIWAEPTTITGSIGVFGMFPNFKQLMNEHGLTVDVAKTSNMADALTAFRPKTQEELDSLQTIVDHAYEGFINRVCEGRKLERAHVEEIAQGRVWSGTRAKELGLVDELGGLREAVTAAAERAKLDEYQWHQYQNPKRFAEELMEVLEDRDTFIATPKGPMEQGLINLQETYRKLQLFDQPNKVYALLPFSLKIN